MPLIPSKYVGGMPDGCLPTEYMMLHPDGKYMRLNAFNSDVAIKAGRNYAKQWVREAAGEELQRHEDGLHTLYTVDDIHVDAFGDSCIELHALWEMSTREIYDAVRAGTWPNMAPRDAPKCEPGVVA